MTHPNLSRTPHPAEAFLLGVFRVLLLVVMAGALVGGLGLGVYAVSMYNHTPVASDPTPVPRVEQIRVDQLLNKLDPPPEGDKKDTAALPGPTTNGTNGAGASRTLMYLEDVTAMYRCLVDFTKSAGIETTESDLDAASKQIEAYRLEIQKVADALDSRGALWVKDAARFTCDALQSPRMLSLQKEGRLQAVASVVLNFHVTEWDRLQLERAQQERLSSQKTAEDQLKRAALEEKNKTEAMRLFVIAGAALAGFMALALFLILLRMEFSLRAMAGNGTRPQH